MAALDLLRGNDAVHVRHSDIHQNHVRLALFEQFERLEPVRRNADDLDLGTRGEHAPDPVRENGLIVRQKHPYLFFVFHIRYLVLSFRTPSAGSVM